MKNTYSIVENKNTLKIIIPYQTNWYRVVSGLFGISVGLLIFAPSTFIPLLTDLNENKWGNPNPIFLFFSLGLLLVLFSILVEVLWQVIGKEVIYICNDSIVIRHQIFGIGISKKLYQNKITGIILAASKVHSPIFRRSEFLYFYRGYLEIRHKNIFNGTSVYRLGSGLEKKKIEEIITILENKFLTNKPNPKVAG